MAGPMPSEEPIPERILNASTEAGEAFITQENDTLTWGAFTSSTPIRNLTIPFTATALSNVFTTTINSPDRQQVLFRFGSSGPFTVWINGTIMVQKQTHHDFKKDEFSFYATLKRGGNHIVVMNTHWQDIWAFALTNPLYDHGLTHGIIKDNSGRPVSDATVKFLCGNSVVSYTTSSEDGIYALDTPDTPSQCRLKAFKGNEGAWVSAFPEGKKSARIDLTLRETPSISGQALMYDGQTPLNAIFLEAIDASTGKLVASTITDEYGEYSLSNIPPGRYHIKNSNQTASFKTNPAETQHVVYVDAWNSLIELDLTLTRFPKRNLVFFNTARRFALFRN